MFFVTKEMTWIAPRLTDGLGNRLFQYAAAAGLAEKWGWPIVFFLPQCGPTNHGPFETIFKLFPLTRIVDTEYEWELLTEPEKGIYTYYPLPDEPPSTKFHVLQGYRQSEKYFPKNFVLDFENALGAEQAASIRQKIPEPNKTWFVHVRLGDYKKLIHHQINLEAYYNKCLVEIPRGSSLILMSDELELCRGVFGQVADQLGLDFSICDTDDELVTLYLMSLCHGGAITANSTFSWWGAYCAHQTAPPTFRAFFPSSWGVGMPEPKDITPSWGNVVTLTS